METENKSWNTHQHPITERVHRLASNVWLFRILLLRILPLGFFTGLKVVKIDDRVCSVSVPFKWLNKNPFRSVYFAVLSMAAEMSTGLPAFSYTWKSVPAISMLVTGMKATFTKKAAGTVIFTFSGCKEMQQAIQKAVDTGESVTLECESIGATREGTEICRFYLTWSFRVKPVK